MLVFIEDQGRVVRYEEHTVLGNLRVGAFKHGADNILLEWGQMLSNLAIDLIVLLPKLRVERD